MKMTNKTYDILKWIAQYLLPALGTLYFGLSKIWGFPYGEEIVGTIGVVDTFLGVILGISTAQYNEDLINGIIVYTDEDEEECIECEGELNE